MLAHQGRRGRGRAARVQRAGGVGQPGAPRGGHPAGPPLQQVADLPRLHPLQGPHARDFTNPAPRRVIEVLSALINFLLYMHGKVELLQAIVSKAPNYHEIALQLKARTAQFFPVHSLCNSPVRGNAQRETTSDSYSRVLVSRFQTLLPNLVVAVTLVPWPSLSLQRWYMDVEATDLTVAWPSFLTTRRTVASSPVASTATSPFAHRHHRGLLHWRHDERETRGRMVLATVEEGEDHHWRRNNMDGVFFLASHGSCTKIGVWNWCAVLVLGIQVRVMALRGHPIQPQELLVLVACQLRQPKLHLSPTW